jgi:hypothetical protein
MCDAVHILKLNTKSLVSNPRHASLYCEVRGNVFNLLTPESNPSAQRRDILLGILIFNGLTAGRFISRSTLKGSIIYVL